MDRQQVLDFLRKDLAEDLGWEIDRVLETSQLDSDLGMDSLDVVEFAMRVEEHYGVDFPDEDLESWEGGTVARIADYVASKVA